MLEIVVLQEQSFVISFYDYVNKRVSVRKVNSLPIDNYVDIVR